MQLLNHIRNIALNHYRFYWDILIVLSLVFTVILLPISIAFYSEDQLMPEWIAINGIVDLLFVSDIIVNFRTGIVKGDKEDEVCCTNIEMCSNES